jgi:hypothetical protein
LDDPSTAALKFKFRLPRSLPCPRTLRSGL